MVMARGGYTFDDIRQMSTSEITFLYHYQRLVVQEQQQFLVSTLGVVWDRESVSQVSAESGSNSTPAAPLTKLFIPLSLAINPDVADFVKSQFGVSGASPGKAPYIAGGDYIPKSNENIVSMGELSRDEFLEMIGRKPKKSSKS